MHLPELLMLPAPYFECFLRTHLLTFTFLFTLSSGFLWFCALWAVAALYLGCAAACSKIAAGRAPDAAEAEVAEAEGHLVLVLKAAVVFSLMQRLDWLF